MNIRYNSYNFVGTTIDGKQEASFIFAPSMKAAEKILRKIYKKGVRIVGSNRVRCKI